MDYQPSYGFLKDCLYRSESYKVTLADAYVDISDKDATLSLQGCGYSLNAKARYRSALATVDW